VHQRIGVLVLRDAAKDQEAQFYSVQACFTFGVLHYYRTILKKYDQKVRRLRVDVDGSHVGWTAPCAQSIDGRRGRTAVDLRVSQRRYKIPVQVYGFVKRQQVRVIRPHLLRPQHAFFRYEDVPHHRGERRQPRRVLILDQFPVELVAELAQ
jgi:hypothetical protein